MNITDFDIYKDLLKEKSGLIVTQDKSYLLESRLNPIAKKWGFEDIAKMTNALRGVPDKALVIDIVEAMTTNETSFFRDNTPFETFKNHVIPYYKSLPNRMNKQLKLWCAAASSGQEPYSLAMLWQEEATQLPGWSLSMKATDISNEILDQAREGVYTQFEVQRGLPITHLMKYFAQEGDKWRINADIRNMIKYEYFNLLDSMTMLGQFDIIFCRNVLIYFDQPTKKDIMERMHKQMADDGLFFLGGAETVMGITEMFEAVPGVRGLYAKKGSVHTQKAA